jgi:2-polyprenyl-3-methyl-5-hydroxy-6-metoxy-1,4-benzoquinol methylase
MLSSIACRYEDFSKTWYKNQESALKIREIFGYHSAAKVDFVNRKFWEWCAIAQALEERSKLLPGVQGLGFAVGQEPLSSFFSAKGCNVLATDLGVESSTRGWIDRNEHAASKNALYFPQLVERDQFDRNLSFQPADMRTLKGLTGAYDFIWSSCALEHLGTLQAGLEFVQKSSRFLREGGVAVHTTEFNVRSDSKTVEKGGNVIYRQRDLLKLADALKREGLRLADLDFDTGSHPYDLEFDVPPYMESDRRHIKLEIDGYVATSFLLIIERSGKRRFRLFGSFR